MKTEKELLEAQVQHMSDQWWTTMTPSICLDILTAELKNGDAMTKRQVKYFSEECSLRNGYMFAMLNPNLSLMIYKQHHEDWEQTAEQIVSAIKGEVAHLEVEAQLNTYPN